MSPHQSAPLTACLACGLGCRQNKEKCTSLLPSVCRRLTPCVNLSAVSAYCKSGSDRLRTLSEVCAFAQTSSERRLLHNTVSLYVRSHSLPRRALRYPQGEAFRFFDFIRFAHSAQNDTVMNYSVKFRDQAEFYPACNASRHFKRSLSCLRSKQTRRRMR